MDFKKIKKLVSLVETSDISSLCVEEDNLKVEIKKEGTQPIVATNPIQQTSTQKVTEEIKPETAPDPQKNDTNLIEIASPMVGTFYTAANPESKPFVSTGTSINKGDIVCVIEAMKLFNEIESEVSGTIEKICVENGSPVEFSQALFLVRQN